MSLPKLKTAALVLLIAGLVLAAGLVTYYILGHPPNTPGPKPTPPEWRPDPALLKRLKTEPSLTPREALDERIHYSLKFPDDADCIALGQFLPIQPGGQSPNEENIFSITTAYLLVYVKRATPKEREGRPFERSWNVLKNQRQAARNFAGLEHGDIEEGMVNGSRFYRARVINNGRRGYAYVSYNGEQVIYLVFMVPKDGSEDAAKLAEAVVLTWQKQ